MMNWRRRSRCLMPGPNTQNRSVVSPMLDTHRHELVRAEYVHAHGAGRVLKVAHAGTIPESAVAKRASWRQSTLQPGGAVPTVVAVAAAVVLAVESQREEPRLLPVNRDARFDAVARGCGGAQTLSVRRGGFVVAWWRGQARGDPRRRRDTGRWGASVAVVGRAATGGWRTSRKRSTARSPRRAH